MFPSDISEEKWACSVKLHLYLCSPSDGNQRPLPDIFLYSGFSLKSKLRVGAGIKKHIQKSFLKFFLCKSGPFREGISRAFSDSGSTAASVVYFRSALRG